MRVLRKMSEDNGYGLVAVRKGPENIGKDWRVGYERKCSTDRFSKCHTGQGEAEQIQLEVRGLNVGLVLNAPRASLGSGDWIGSDRVREVPLGRL